MAEISPEFAESSHRSGQQANVQDSYVLPFVEFEAPYTDDGGIRVTGFEGMAGYEITPIDEKAARVRITDSSAVADILSDITSSAPTTIPRLDFPPVLHGVAVTYNMTENNGEDSHPESQQSVTIYGTGSGTIAPNSSSQGGASIMPDIQPDIEERYHVNVPAMEYTFYLADPSDMAAALSKLSALAGATVNPWPQFHPEPVTLTLKGQQVSVSAKADSRVFVGGSTESGSAGFEWGNGQSIESGITVKTERLSPTIHGAITIDDDTMSATAEATADASTPDFFPGAIEDGVAINNTKSVSVDIEASVSPNSIAATDPASIPSTGLYLYQLNPGPQIFGVNAFRGIVVDFDDL